MLKLPQRLWHVIQFPKVSFAMTWCESCDKTFIPNETFNPHVHAFIKKELINALIVGNVVKKDKNWKFQKPNVIFVAIVLLNPGESSRRHPS
jgi:hypothetical protein